METYLPIIQTILSDWLQFSSEHTLYAVSVAVIVWLLTAFLYSFRTSSLKKQITASDTAKTAAETALESTQQQLQQAQDDLSTANQHFIEQKQAAETQQQRAKKVEKQLAERNQQLAVIIQKFASSFDIGERPVPVTADLKADDLWQQHDKAVAKLLDNLRTEQLAKTELQKFYQAEKDKVVAVEARLHSLQSSLDEQTSLLNTLQNQNNALEQQQNAAQHALSEAMQATSAQIQPTPATALVDNTDNLKNLFKKPKPKPVISVPDPIVTEVLVTSVEDKAPVLDVKPTPEPIVAPKSVAEVQPKTAPELEKAGLKSVFNKFTAKASAEKTTVAVEAKPAPEPKEKTKLKGLFNKFTTKPDAEKLIVTAAKPEPALVIAIPEIEAKPIPEPIIALTTNATPTINKAKGAYPVPDSKLSDDIPSTRIEDLADKITDTVEGFKKLFSKKS